jgi:hypothetical protein
VSEPFWVRWRRPAALVAKWRRSTTSFGPVGRMIATVVVISPMALMYSLNGPYMATVLGMASYPVLIVLALRRIWTPVREPRVMLPPVPIENDVSSTTPRDPISDRSGARRW